jgi:hypothetical protein
LPPNTLGVRRAQALYITALAGEQAAILCKDEEGISVPISLSVDLAAKGSHGDTKDISS